MGTFANSIRNNSDKMLRDVNDKMYRLVDELFSQVVYATPVLDGYLINSWYSTAGNNFSSAKSPVPDKSGSGSLMNIQSLKQHQIFYAKDGVATMTNNQDYAYRVEYLGWSRYKAPYGMVRVSLSYVANKYK